MPIPYTFRHLAVATASLLALSGTAQATLHDRGPDMVYDDVLNITWLKDWGASGFLNWADANAWAQSLSVGGFTGWRLPTVLDTGTPGCDYSAAGGTDCGFNAQTIVGNVVHSELAHVYYVSLGNLGYAEPGTGNNPQAGWGLANTGPFANIQSDYYWTGTSDASQPGFAWRFLTLDGSQDSYGDKRDGYFAVAVRNGDVLAPVPEPQAWALMALGLVAVGSAARRRAGR